MSQCVSQKITEVKSQSHQQTGNGKEKIRKHERG